MRKLLLTSAAAFTLTASPSVLLAQNAPADGEMQTPSDSTSARPTATSTSQGTSQGTSPGPTESGATAQQRSIYSGWPAERRGEFDALPTEQQTYYWTLPQEQQEGFWALTPDQRARLYNMSPEQRQSAWQSIMQQLQGQDSMSPAGQPAQPGAGAPDTGTQASGNMPVTPAQPAGADRGALTPPAAEAMNKDYPVCSRTVQDSCRNPGGK